VRNQPGAAGGQARAGGPGRGAELDKSTVGAEWPLIRFILDQPAYLKRYNEAVRKFASGPFEPGRAIKRVGELAAVRATTAAAGAGSSADAYSAAVESLVEVIRARSTAIATYLASAG
jgi:hypothetical protein